MSTFSPERAHAAQHPARRLAAGPSENSEYDQIFIPRTGMKLPKQLPYEKWLGIGRRLAAVSTSSAWCLGDWLIYGEDAYNGRYRDAIEQTSLDYQTLRNYAWVARRFPLYRRRDTLSFAHHAEVAGLSEPEQDFWLRKAAGLSWSRNRLRQEVRASLAERAASDGAATHSDRADNPPGSGGASAGEVDPESSGEVAPSEGIALPLQADVNPALILVKLSPEQMESCHAVAARLGCSIEEWAASALERVAREELGQGNSR
jgi:hypothetical protein